MIPSRSSASTATSKVVVSPGVTYTHLTSVTSSPSAQTGYAQNHFKAYPAGDEDSDRIDLICKPKQEVTLQVVVEADDKTGLTYSWYKSVYDSVEEWFTDRETIEGADSDHYTVTARAKERYSCTVSDQYGNSKTI